MPLSKVNIERIAEDDTVTSASIADDTIVNADINASAAIGTGKTADTFKTQTEATTDFNQKHFNVALLGFKMAVQDSLTVFNLVDGVIDEFHDESGTDEGEGSNDNYCATSDFYDNVGSSAISAGFSISAITEPQTSVTSTNPTQKTNTLGQFTVPSGMTSVNMQAWGASGGTSGYPYTSDGGGGGYAEGTLAVTSSQVLHISAGKGGYAWGPSGPAGIGPNSGGKISFFGGGQGGAGTGNGGGGLAGVLSVTDNNLDSAPEAYLIAGAGGGGGHEGSSSPAPSLASTAGGGGGLVGETGAGGGAQVNENVYAGGGGDQEQGGTAGGVNEPSGAPAPQADGRGFNPASAPFPNGDRPGGLFYGGRGTQFSGGGGSGYYGGGGGGFGMSGGTIVDAGGGGGSSYYGHPQITSGSTEAGTSVSGGGTTQPNYVAGTNETSTAPNTPLAPGEDGFVLITGTAQATGSTTIVSNAFTAGSAPSKSRIVVFQEDVDSTTLNTDIVASVSRNGGSNFSTVTLVDEGYVTGASGQRVLAGLVDISGQPSGTSMRWKLALANNQSKIHGVSLSWA